MTDSKCLCADCGAECVDHDHMGDMWCCMNCGAEWIENEDE